ncbi:type VI secretion system-associated protein TagO [Rhizobium sp.]|uniref:type VI secretion system-associated protein TagO n=1 Tax=Rhizobium sp. TaxID=391 RepID=UPI002AA6A5B5
MKTYILSKISLNSCAIFVCIFLCFHFEIASAETRETPETCAKVTDSYARKFCYEDLEKAGVKIPTPVPEWVITTEKSKMDDSNTINLNLKSIDSSTNINIRCEEKVTTVYFTLGDFMSDIQGYGTIRYRVDKEKAQKKNFLVSTDNEALGLWSSKSSIPFLKQILGHKKLTTEITAYNASPTISEFDLAGLEGAVGPLRKNCGW